MHCDGGRTMRKLTECLIVLAFLLCAFTAQAASEIDVSVPSAGEPCTSDLSCDPGEVCISDICSVARPCTNDLQCDPGELCIDDICKEGECVNDEDCKEGLVCASYMCVECATWKDCDNETEICADNNTCVLADDCDLQIRPKRIKIKRNQRVTWRTFKLAVKGNENFPNPFIRNSDGTNTLDYDLSPLFEVATNKRWFQKRRLFEVVVGAYTDEESGTYTLRFGKCLVDFEIENNNILIKK